MTVDYDQYWDDRLQRNYMPVMPRHREIVRVINERGKSSSILDLGCGEGHILKMLPDSCQRYGCDISKTPLDLINDKRIHCVLCDLNNDFPFDLDFDVIVASEVLEHLQNPHHVLEKAKEHLAKDGLFLVTIPNVALWRHRLQLLRGRFPGYDPTHVNHWDVDSFIELLTSYGYKISNYYPTYFIFPRYLGRIFFLRPRLLYKLFGEQFLFVATPNEEEV